MRLRCARCVVDTGPTCESLKDKEREINIQRHGIVYNKVIKSLVVQ